MDHVAVYLAQDSGWTYLGGDAEARKDLEVVLRAFDQTVEFATGPDACGPDGDALRVPAGEGRRLQGRHFYARPTATGPCRITRRGI